MEQGFSSAPPSIRLEGEALATDPQTAGLRILEELGLDPVHIGSIQLNAGGKCIGDLATFIGMDEHAPVRDGVIETVQTAKETGEDPADAVIKSLTFFVKRDENKQPVRSGAEALKKN